MLTRLRNQTQQQGNQQAGDQQDGGGNGQSGQSAPGQKTLPENQVSTTMKKRQGSVDLYQKFADTLDAIKDGQ